MLKRLTPARRLAFHCLANAFPALAYGFYGWFALAILAQAKEESLLFKQTSQASERRVQPGRSLNQRKIVAQALVNPGVTFLLDQNVSLDQIERNGNAVQIQLGEKRVEADLVLMAIGRKANSGGIGLGALGIDDRSFLDVDKQMRLPAPDLYGVGDVNGISLLDSTAFSQASTTIGSILGGESRFDRRQTSRCVHTKPVVAAVGWSQQDAEAQGIEYLAVPDTMRDGSPIGRFAEAGLVHRLTSGRSVTWAKSGAKLGDF